MLHVTKCQKKKDEGCVPLISNQKSEAGLVSISHDAWKFRTLSVFAMKFRRKMCVCSTLCSH